MGLFDFDSFDCDDCEKDWVFGSSGTCDLENSTCVCKPGFSGKDDWMTYKTCHVNDSVRLIIHQVALANASLNFLICVYCFISMTLRWGFMKIDGCKVTFPNLNLFSSEPPNMPAKYAMSGKVVPERVKELLRRDYVRKRYSWLVCFCLMSFTFWGIIYQASYVVNKDSRQPGGFGENVGLGIQAFFIWAAIYVLLLAWYYTLPNLRHNTFFSELSPLLSHSPQIVSQIVTTIILFTAFLGLFCVIILPYINRDWQGPLDFVFLLGILIDMALYLAMQVYLVRTVRKLFKMTLKAFDEPGFQTRTAAPSFESPNSLQLSQGSNSNLNNSSTTFQGAKVLETEDSKVSEDKKMIHSSLRAATLFNIFGFNLAGGGFVVNIIMFIAEQKYQYVLFNFFASLAYLYSGSFSVLIAFYTGGGLMPVNEMPTKSLKTQETGLLTEAPTEEGSQANFSKFKNKSDNVATNASQTIAKSNLREIDL